MYSWRYECVIDGKVTPWEVGAKSMTHHRSTSEDVRLRNTRLLANWIKI